MTDERLADGPEIVPDEVPTLRKTAPLSVQMIMGARYRQIRVSRAVAAKQRLKHRSSIEVCDELDRVLADWEYTRKQPANEAPATAGERWQFVTWTLANGKRLPFLVVLERDQDGRLSLVTAHLRRASWGEAWVQQESVRVRGG